ncbi:MAG TPA: hypothetical protein VIV60_29235 [Polyangiaceae bacterium]
MTELSPEARRLLGLARRGDDPRETDRMRLRHRMAKQWAVATSVSTVALGTAKAAASAVTVPLLFGKGLIAGVLLTVVSGGVWKVAEHVVVQQRTRAEAVTANHGKRLAASSIPAAIDVRREGPSDATTTTLLPAVSGPVEPARQRETPMKIVPIGRADQLRHRVVAAAPNPMATSAVAAPDPVVASFDPLQAEVAGLREVQTAMSAGHAAQSLSLLDDLDARFASGTLTQERAAARIFALCQLGRLVEARSRARSFEQHWPRSPIVARVRRACDSSPSP